jgi:acyl carrier protein
MDNTITANLTKYIAANILKQPDRPITLDEKLITSGLIDSFSLVDLSIYIEETFAVRIDDTELNADTFNTLAELSQLIRQRQPGSK